MLFLEKYDVKHGGDKVFCIIVIDWCTVFSGLLDMYPYVNLCIQNRGEKPLCHAIRIMLCYATRIKFSLNG